MQFDIFLPVTVRWALAVLATYRLAELVALDVGPLQVFARIRAWAGCHPSDLIRENLGELLHCPFCLGVWFGLFCALLALWPTLGGDLILAASGLAGGQAFLSTIGGNHADKRGSD